MNNKPGVTLTIGQQLSKNRQIRQRGSIAYHNKFALSAGQGHVQAVWIGEMIAQLAINWRRNRRGKRDNDDGPGLFGSGPVAIVVA